MNHRQIPRINWFRVLQDLQEHHMPVIAVAKNINLPKSTILGWKQDAEPRHGDGELLLALWVKVTGKPRDKAPRVVPLELRNTDANDEDSYINSVELETVNQVRRSVATLTADGWIC